MEIKVKLEQIRPVETFGENGFKVQRIWVISDYDTSHPQILQFDLSPKLIGKLDKLTSGIVMTLYFKHQLSTLLRGTETLKPTM